MQYNVDSQSGWSTVSIWAQNYSRAFDGLDRFGGGDSLCQQVLVSIDTVEGAISILFIFIRDLNTPSEPKWRRQFLKPLRVRKNTFIIVFHCRITWYSGKSIDPNVF